MSANARNALRHKEFRRLCHFDVVPPRSKQRGTLCAEENTRVFGQLRGRLFRCRFLYRLVCSSRIAVTNMQT
jgi:hypothetical protein